MCQCCMQNENIQVCEALQEPESLLSNLEIKTPLNKIPLLGDILFYVYKMNEIVNKFYWQEINLSLKCI